MRTATIAIFSLFIASETSGQVTRRVSDPYQAEYFSCAGKPDGRLFNDSNEKYGYSGLRIIADLNFDGREDLILSKSDRTGSPGCGNSGCPVAIFLMQPDKTYTSLDYWLHPLAVALSMIGPGQGQLVTYGRISAGEGALGFERITSDSLTRISTQTIHVNDSASDEALYRSWFHGDKALKAQYARCEQGNLTWSDSYN